MILKLAMQKEASMFTTGMELGQKYLTKVKSGAKAYKTYVSAGVGKLNPKAGNKALGKHNKLTMKDRVKTLTGNEGLAVGGTAGAVGLAGLYGTKKVLDY